MSKHILGLCGPSGAGKGYITNELILRGFNVERIISYTTRKPREGEKNGVHYYFITPEEFKTMETSGAFFESNTWRDSYGTPKSEFERIQKSGKIPVLEIGHNGMIKMQDIFKNSDWELIPVAIFPGELPYEEIYKNNPKLSLTFDVVNGIPKLNNDQEKKDFIEEYKKILKSRLILRGTETTENIEKRIMDAEEILSFFLSGEAEKRGFKMISNTKNGEYDPIRELLLRVNFLELVNETHSELKLNIK